MTEQLLLDSLPEVGRRAPWVPEYDWRDFLDREEGIGPGIESVQLDGAGMLAVCFFFEGRGTPRA